MKPGQELENKLIKNPLTLNEKDFHEIRSIFGRDKKRFIHLINDMLRRVKKIDHLSAFSFVIGNLEEEIREIALFLYSNVNRIYYMLYKNNHFKMMADYSFLIEACGNVQIFELLSDIIRNKDSLRFVSTIEMYKLKKALFELSKRLDRQNEVTVEIKAELEEADLEWKESLD